MIILPILLAVIVVFAAFRYQNHLKAKARRCAKEAQKFHEKQKHLSAPGRKFTDEELHRLKYEFAPLLEDVNSLYDNYFISNSFLDSLGLGNFLEERRLLNHTQYVNNQNYKPVVNRPDELTCRQNKVAWNKYLASIQKIVIFDTETTGLEPGKNVIVSLSWQVFDNRLNKTEAQTCFFNWPEDKDRVDMDAIKINGLTEQRLQQLGTTDKAEGLRSFAETIANADLLVAHNGGFDIKFVKADAEECSVTFAKREIPLWDTMVNMTDYCAIQRSDGKYKWPKLYELADRLGVNTDDIHLHHSSDDVEVTARCFRKIVLDGLSQP